MSTSKRKFKFNNDPLRFKFDGVELAVGSIVSFEVENQSIWGGDNTGTLVFVKGEYKIRIYSPEIDVTIGQGYDAYPGSIRKANAHEIAKTIFHDMVNYLCRAYPFSGDRHQDSATAYKYYKDCEIAGLDFQEARDLFGCLRCSKKSFGYNERMLAAYKLLKDTSVRLQMKKIRIEEGGGNREKV